MAKLVEILALEMEEWPEGVTHLTQSNVDREIYDARDGQKEDSVDSLNPRFDTRKSHTEDAYPIVTRAQWQAERYKQKGGEWKRHRGGSVPVDALAVVEVKLRDATLETHRAECFNWRHDKTPDDIMSYRVISQPQAEEPMKAKFDGVKLEFSRDGVNFSEIGTARIDNICDLGPAEPQRQQSTGPLTWRDTIIHCQAIIEDCEREIQANVNLLDSEGLMMQLDPKKGMQAYDVPAVDMGDWRNWKEGDLLKVVDSVDDTHNIDEGEIVVFDGQDINRRMDAARCTYNSDIRHYWILRENVEFHSRP